MPHPLRLLISCVICFSWWRPIIKVWIVVSTWWLTGHQNGISLLRRRKRDKHQRIKFGSYWNLVVGRWELYWELPSPKVKSKDLSLNVFKCHLPNPPPHKHFLVSNESYGKLRLFYSSAMALILTRSKDITNFVLFSIYLSVCFFVYDCLDLLNSLSKSW